MNIGQLLENAGSKLALFESGRLEAEILLAHALDVKRSFLYANSDFVVPAKRRSDYLRLVRLRCAGRPIAYLTGKRSFWKLELYVSEDVLIPRPETEMLVEAALERLPDTAGKRVADLGTGSGAIALSIALERPQCEIHATDLSEAALAMAQKNSRVHGIENVRFHLGDFTKPLEGWFDLLVSNPPYVNENDPHLTLGDCRFEPTMALSPGKDGLGAIRSIASSSPALLKPGGWLLLEHGHDQGEAVRNLMLENGFERVTSRVDLAGIERICLGRMP